MERTPGEEINRGIQERNQQERNTGKESRRENRARNPGEQS